ncbi:MAG: efflux RND transporter permease subunit [Bdellovibrionaceae bacterium]|nr:efflux RND transporter permease subunit [Pseudobdellovibrionaceae bacterium]
MNLAALSIKRPIFITCIVILMLIMGFVSLKKMPVDLFPDVTFPTIFVQITYPGASPIDVEKQVAKPIEDELGSLSGLKTLTSNNLDSAAFVILQFKLGTDIKEVEQQVRNRINNVRRKLPNDIKEPIIRRFDPADQAVMTLAILSKLDAAKLYDIVDEQIKPQVERIPDVGQLNIVGGRKQEIHILVDKDKLQDRNLSMSQISRRIEDTSKDVPIGKVENTKKETVLRTLGEFNSLSQIENISVNFLGSDRSVKLKEIATVERSLEDVKRVSSIDNQNAIFLDVFKQSGSNTVAVTDAVKSTMEKINAYLQQKNIDAKLILIRDSSIPIRLNIADVKESISIGILLCIVVVFFFLGSFRSTFITGMALPNSLLGGFVLMMMMGFSINIMTLLALSLAVGLLIDDAIVVRENIFRHMEMGKDPIKAALEGTAEVSQAVIATTLVVIAVFGPIAFVQGIIGQFFRQFGLTIVFTMLISLFDAFTMAPMLSAYLATKNEHEKGNGPIAYLLKAFDRLQTKLEDLYESTIRMTLKFRKSVLVFAIFVFIFSMFLAKYVPKTFLPPNDIGEFAIIIEKPVGTSIYETESFMKTLEEKIREEKSIQLIARTVGTNEGEANKGNYFIKLVPAKERKYNTTEIKDIMRTRLNEFAKDATIAVTDIDISGGGQKPLNLYLTGENLETLTQFANDLKVRLSKIQGLVDVDTNFRSGKPEFHVKFDRERSEALGVSTVVVGNELRARTEGTEPAIFRENGIEYKVRLRFKEEDRDLRANFGSTQIPNSNFNMIPLSRVAKGEDSLGYSQINRQNKNRFIAITANLASGGNLGSVTQEIESILKNEIKPPLGVEYAFVGQAEDFKDLMANMILAMGLGIIFIYLVLASLYESFITPITILLALPLAISGAMGGLFIFNKTIDIFSLIGIVMLLGVVAKNSILLVDYTKKLIDEGQEINAALIKACRTRLRPILMTSFALIAGTLPIAIGLTELGAQRQSMGVSIIGGVVSSTLLTLIVVPAAFGYIENFSQRMRKLAKKLV